MKTNKYIVAALALVAMVGCNKEVATTNFADDGSDDGYMEFSTSSIIGSTKVNSAGTEWESGDNLGLFMQYADAEYGANNVAYTLLGSGTDVSLGYADSGKDKIAVPEEDATFYAYYPYQSGAANDNIEIDLSNQSDLGAIDFLVAKSEWTTSDSRDVTFGFAHALAKVTFGFAFKENITAITSMEDVSITGLSAKAYYNIEGEQLSTEDGEAIAMNISSDLSTLSVIVHPTTEEVSPRISLTVNGVEWVVDISNTFEAGTQYDYTINIGEDYAVVDDDVSIYPWYDYLDVDGSISDNLTSITYQDGSAEFPYLISTKEDLVALATEVTAGSSKSGLYYELTNNIYLLGSEDSQFSPIGRNSSNRAFSGTFDGAGYTISGLYINDDSYNGRALFSCLSGGTVKNLTVKGEVSSTGYFAAGLVGFAENSTIENCVADVAVSGGGSCGVILGYADESVTIKDCIGYGSVNSTYYRTGGVCGAAYSGSSIINCVNYASVSGEDYYTGGVVGYVYSSTISDCSNNASVSGEDYYTGGVVGSVESSSTISDCYNYASVSGETNYTGGVAGYVYSSTISGCSNNASVSGVGTKTGGVVGSVESSSTISDCSNNASVSGVGTQTGGVAGYVNRSTISDCSNNASVSGEGNQTGGVCGGVYYASSISNCVNNASVSEEGSYTGGVVGYTTGSDGDTPTISNSINYGSVTSANTYLGGIAGCAYRLTMLNCANYGDVTSSMAGDNIYIGGLTGTVQYGTPYIYNSYNAGEVTAPNSTGSYCTGALVGNIGISTGTMMNCFNVGETDLYDVTYNNSGTIDLVYYLENNGIGASKYTISATSCTSAYMQSQEFVDLLNENADDIDDACEWVYNAGKYPTLEIESRDE